MGTFTIHMCRATSAPMYSGSILDFFQPLSRAEAPDEESKGQEPSIPSPAGNPSACPGESEFPCFPVFTFNCNGLSAYARPEDIKAVHRQILINQFILQSSRKHDVLLLQETKFNPS